MIHPENPEEYKSFRHFLHEDHFFEPDLLQWLRAGHWSFYHLSKPEG